MIPTGKAGAPATPDVAATAPVATPTDPAPAAWMDFLGVEELPLGAQRSIPYRFTRLLFCHTGDGIFAIADLCPHALQPLAGAEISDGVIRCPKHGAQFALATGKPQNGVTPASLRTYPVKVTNGRIWADVK
jgi:nitrite reductase/ring-hydroxylating ferredoxin subunit